MFSSGLMHPEARSNGFGRSDEWVVGRNQSLLACDLHEVDVLDRAIAEHHDLILYALEEEFDGRMTELGRENPVRRDWCAASLHMAQHRGSGFNARFSFHQIGNQRADPTQPDGVGGALHASGHHGFLPGDSRAFRARHDGKTSTTSSS